QDNAWQCKPGSPELNCCSVNAPGGPGLASEWAVLRQESNTSRGEIGTAQLVLNYYGASEMTIPLDSKIRVKLTQETNYPRERRVHLHVSPSRAARFTLKLRIP